MITPQDWHRRYVQQALWTASLRQYVYDALHLEGAVRLLEVGCGTGAISADLQRRFSGTNTAPVPLLHGLDIDRSSLQFAHQNDPNTCFTCADALRLPYAGQAFDASLCHYFLLWMRQPEATLGELLRVTRPGGFVAALAEPDYGGRIDYPPALAELGKMQAAALTAQGADTHMGRKLAGLFARAGLKDVHTGLLGGEWSAPPTPEAWQSEWDTLQKDMGHLLSTGELEILRDIDAAAWQRGERVLFVPTFYAYGRVP